MLTDDQLTVCFAVLNSQEEEHRESGQQGEPLWSNHPASTLQSMKLKKRIKLAQRPPIRNQQRHRRVQAKRKQSYCI
jgi:hypothetical protein